jgi:putative intracellular protease/amidase
VALAVFALVGLLGGALASQWHRIKDLLDPPQQTAVGEPHPAPTPPSTAPVTPISGGEPVKPAPVVQPQPVKPLLPSVKPPPPPTVPARHKQVLVLVPPDFASGELTTVSDTLKQRGVGGLVVGPERKPLDGYRFGGAKGPTHVRTIDPELGAKEVTNGIVDACDGVIIIPGDPSAYGPKGVAGAEFARIIKRMIQQKKPVGAIGSGILELGTHGFLEHAEVSTYTGRPMAVAQLKVKKWVPEPKVVVDLPIITTGEFSHARALTEEVVKAIPERAGK